MRATGTADIALFVIAQLDALTGYTVGSPALPDRIIKVGSLRVALFNRRLGRSHSSKNPRIRFAVIVVNLHDTERFFRIFHIRNTLRDFIYVCMTLNKSRKYAVSIRRSRH